jgi:hypothetical protein
MAMAVHSIARRGQPCTTKSSDCNLDLEGIPSALRSLAAAPFGASQHTPLDAVDDNTTHLTQYSPPKDTVQQLRAKSNRTH